MNETLLNDAIAAAEKNEEHAGIDCKAAIRFLVDRGWATYYNPSYFVHTKTVVDPTVQDYTNYGLPLCAAVKFEVEEMEGFRPMFVAGATVHHRDWSDCVEIARNMFSAVAA